MIKLFWRFLRESEKTRAKCPGIDSGSPRVLNQNGQKKRVFQVKMGKKTEPFKPKWAEKANKTRILSVR
jgi:hypothetical protein